MPFLIRERIIIHICRLEKKQADSITQIIERNLNIIQLTPREFSNKSESESENEKLSNWKHRQEDRN